MQCHDAPAKHRLGSYWQASAHATMPMSGSRSTNVGCMPCHNGPALAELQKNPTAPVYANSPTQPSISCQSCHDPHSHDNPNQLRLMTSTPLKNGYVIPAGAGGKGQLCMNCHQTRYDATAKVEAQARVFSDRFYAHYSEQADMYFGQNAYEFGRPLAGLMTHQGVENSCVTCHMSQRVNGSSVHSNHQMSMHDETGKDIVTSCKSCHGEIEKFDDILAMDDYDGNGLIEGAQTEIMNMMTNLKNILPKDANGEPVTMRVDSMKVKNDELYKKNGGLTLLGAMYNYYYIKYDHSMGVHNTKYTLALLKATFSALASPVSVSPLDQSVPKSYGLAQNYPNPFNPSTNITFSIPQAANVQLHVYNAAGKLVTTLADGYLVPGNYAASWDASEVGSGMYFYRLSVTSNGKNLYSSTKKMVLTK
jgi:nitrate/TMAO reductase-like tetraheme cytochrome c subunit